MGTGVHKDKRVRAVPDLCITVLVVRNVNGIGGVVHRHPVGIKADLDAGGQVPAPGVVGAIAGLAVDD
jgi:hypothetical protein